MGSGFGLRPKALTSHPRGVSGVTPWACPFVASNDWCARSASRSPGFVAGVILMRAGLR